MRDDNPKTQREGAIGYICLIFLIIFAIKGAGEFVISHLTKPSATASTTAPSYPKGFVPLSCPEGQEMRPDPNGSKKNAVDFVPLKCQPIVDR